MMIVYHLLFDFTIFRWMSYDVIMSWPMILFEKVIAYSFILCAGISATITRSNVRRGIITLVAGAVVMAVSFIINAPILFGILQFLGLAMLLYAAVGKYLQRIPERIEPVLWLVLLIATGIITESVLVKVKWLFWLGFRYDGFTSFDYFPMMPYIFLFFLGTWAGRWIRPRREKLPLLEKQAPAVLAWPGRHTLWIYLLHQPVLFGACLAVRDILQNK